MIRGTNIKKKKNFCGGSFGPRDDAAVRQTQLLQTKINLDVQHAYMSIAT